MGCAFSSENGRDTRRHGGHGGSRHQRERQYYHAHYHQGQGQGQGHHENGRRKISPQSQQHYQQNIKQESSAAGGGKTAGINAHHKHMAVSSPAKTPGLKSAPQKRVIVRSEPTTPTKSPPASPTKAVSTPKDPRQEEDMHFRRQHFDRNSVLRHSKKRSRRNSAAKDNSRVESPADTPNKSILSNGKENEDRNGRSSAASVTRIAVSGGGEESKKRLSASGEKGALSTFSAGAGKTPVRGQEQTVERTKESSVRTSTSEEAGRSATGYRSATVTTRRTRTTTTTRTTSPEVSVDDDLGDEDCGRLI